MSKEKGYYTTSGVRGLRRYRKRKESPIDGVSDESYQAALGNLRAAGHLRIVNLKSHDIDNRKVVDEDTFETILNNEHTISFTTEHGRTGEDPHVRGYLQSPNSSDPRYRIKGWINKLPNGETSIRIELVD